MKSCSRAFAVLGLTVMLLPVSGQVLAAPGDTTRVSLNSSANEGNSRSAFPTVSAGGRYVGFFSHADNLVAGDTNGVADIFVRDRQTGITTRVSLDSIGNEANAPSYGPSISADGRYVAFQSSADNLVTGDTNGVMDVFVHDRQTGTTTRVNLDSAGNEGNALSYAASISADGRYVAFESNADNLVAGDTNGVADIFVRDRQTGTTTRASLDSANNEGNNTSSGASISGDGRYVVFHSYATNLVTGDTNNVPDVFVRDRQTGTTTRISLDSADIGGNGASTWGTTSTDGRYVAFYSRADNLVAGDTNGQSDVFVRDRQTGTTTRVSLDSANNEAIGGSSRFPTLSADGRYVAFVSSADNLVAGDTNNTDDVFVRDRQTSTTFRVSLDSTDDEGNRASLSPVMSADGRYVAFDSYADNLVTGDTNGHQDVFLRELLGAGGSSTAPIPTLGQWGLIALGLMLGGLGAFAGRQRLRSGDTGASS